MHRITFGLVVGACFLLFAVAPLLAQTGLESTRLQRVLSEPILESATTLRETRALVAGRVPRVPEFRSVEAWESASQNWRQEILAKVVLRGEAAQWQAAKLRVEWLDEMEGGPGYRIRKLRYEALPGLWIPALLYEPLDLRRPQEDSASQVTDLRPVALNVNGHDGNGKAADYKQLRCINLAKRGILALNIEWLGMGQLRGASYSHATMNQLDLCGTSGLAPFYLSMRRALDLLLEHPHADPKRVAVAGLSGGGWQTITISALDTRVTLSNPVAGYSSFLTRNEYLKDLGDSEQTPTDLATIADYTHLTAMLAPRSALLTFNTKDNCCFEAGYALPPLHAAAEPIYRLYNQTSRLRTHQSSDPGDHNFGLDNRQALYRMIGDQFFPGDADYRPEEIPSGEEIKTAEQLAVALPENNASFQSLARELAASLPRHPELPTTPESLADWQAKNREQLKRIIRWQDAELTAEAVEIAKENEITIQRWRLNLGGRWTFPAIEFTPGNATQTDLLVNDGERAAWSDAIAAKVAAGRRVVVIEPFYFGECRFPSHGYLQALLLATIGERPLGIQAMQIAATARWLNARNPQPITLEVQGHRACLFGLVAAAVEPQAISAIRLQGARASLKETIERNEAVTEMPEAFCFGLLEQFDMPQLGALVAPRPLTLMTATERHRTEWASLVGLYQTLLPNHPVFEP